MRAKGSRIIHGQSANPRRKVLNRVVFTVVVAVARRMKVNQNPGGSGKVRVKAGNCPQRVVCNLASERNRTMPANRKRVRSVKYGQ